MAVIERIGRSETRPYVIAWGRLTEEDEHRLRARVAAAPCAQITVDLREIEEITDEGCAAIRNVAEGMDFLSQTMVVLYMPERDATRSLQRTGSSTTHGSCSSRPKTATSRATLGDVMVDCP
jgi:hypothetical protein